MSRPSKGSYRAAAEEDEAASACAAHSGLVTGGAGGRGFAKTCVIMLSANCTSSGCAATCKPRPTSPDCYLSMQWAQSELSAVNASCIGHRQGLHSRSDAAVLRALAVHRPQVCSSMVTFR